MTPIAELVAERFAGPLIRKVVAVNAVAESVVHDEWYPQLVELHGDTVGAGGVGHEQITVAAIFAHLKVPSERRQAFQQRVSKLMQSIGWSNVRVKAADGKYVRGYERRRKPVPEPEPEPEPEVRLPASDLIMAGIALRGAVVQLDEPVAKDFITDLARNVEGVLLDLDLASKYKLTTAGWAQLAANTPLHRLVEEELHRRVRYGTAPREEALVYCVEAPKVLRGIMVDKMAAPGQRIEAIKGLQKTAESQTPGAANGEKFSIHISFGPSIKHNIEVADPQPQIEPLPVLDSEGIAELDGAE